MLNQNYIKIYENVAGDITISYMSCGDDEREVGDAQFISIKADDAHIISKALCELADKMQKEA